MALLLISGVALFLSLMAVAVVLPLRPDVMRITERLVCPPGTKMTVQTVKQSYHRPGERGLVVMCQGSGKSLSVNAKAFLWLWVVFFVASLPPAIVVGILVM